MSTVHDRLTDLRRREYFYDRLLIECDRARETESSFVVVVLRANQTDVASGEAPPVRHLVEAMEPMAREYDWLAPIGVQEVGMFVPNIVPQDTEAFVEDLRGRVEASMGIAGVSLSAGWANYGPELDEAGDLLGQARRMLTQADRAGRAA
jgi:PleD family two-component response regulator